MGQSFCGMWNEAVVVVSDDKKLLKFLSCLWLWEISDRQYFLWERRYSLG